MAAIHSRSESGRAWLETISGSSREASVSTSSAAAKQEQPSGIRTTFERFELKFWLTEPTADRVANFVSPFMQRDPYSGPDKPISRNVSLYLDTRGYLFWHQHRSSALDRRKLRVRAYGDPPTGLAFFEVKRKVKSVTLKGRATLPIEAVRATLLGHPPLRLSSDAERPHLERFVFLQRLHRAEPKIFVAAYREAFVSRLAGQDVRMTIDREIVHQPARGFDLAPHPRAWTAVRGPDDGARWFGRSRALLELKFRGAAPAWIGELTSRFGLGREAFSKYVTAMAEMTSHEAWGLR